MDEMRAQIINKDKAWLVSTLNSAGDAIMTCEQDDRLDFANAEALNILGLSLSEIIGKPFQDIFKIYQDGCNQPVQFWKDDTKNQFLESVGLPKRSYYLRPDGVKCYLSAHLSPLLSDDEKYLGKVVVFRNITRIIDAEITIKNERNNLKMMFDLLPTSMLVVDEEIIIRQVNQAFLRTFNLEEEMIIGKVFGDAMGCVFGQNDGCGHSQNCKFCRFRKIISDVLENKKMMNDKSIKVKFLKEEKEEVRYLNVSIIPIITSNHSEYILTMEDVTEQVYYEKSLKEARESSLLILDTLPVMIYRIDCEHYCDFINQTFRNYMNIDRDTFWKGLSTRMKPNDYSQYLDSLKRSLNEKSNFDIELELLAPDNTYRIFRGMGRPYFDKNLKYSGMIGLFLDIHDERVAEELSAKNQKKYFSLFKYMENSISYYKAIFDENKHLIDVKLEEMNLATEKMFNVKREAVLGRKLSDVNIFEMEEIQKLLTHFEEVLLTGENIHLKEYFMIKQKRWVETSIYSPEPGYIAVLASDINLKKKTELKLKMAIKRSEEANRAKSEFLANMSHEIRTPLNGIVGMIDLTALEPLSEEQKDNLRTAKGCVQSLIDIINDILDFAKIEAGKLMMNPMSFNLIDLVENVTKTHKKHALEKCLELFVNYENLVSTFIISDSMRLKQILNNLISNAIKFTNQGSIEVLVNQTLIPGKINEVMLEISITDTGIGIDPKNYSMLFKSFTQIDGSYTREYGGTGLGLVITKQLIEMMGGKVSFHSQLGVGSTFSIHLPVVITRKPGESAIDSEADISFTGGQILLVENDQVNQIVISKLVESLGAEIDVAKNGVDGVKMASNKKYDIILMDIQMPKMDGIQATQIIHGFEDKKTDHFKSLEIGESLNMETPIIALTAFALEGDEVIFKTGGMDGYLSKPVDRYQLQMLLEKYLDKQIKLSIMNSKDPCNKFIPNLNVNNEQKLTQEEPVKATQKQEADQKINKLKFFLAHGNYSLMEVVAHQLKEIFEKMNAEELKNLVFKMELEIRKDRFEKAKEYLGQIESVWLKKNTGS
ncbi:PAS domain-containing hybrid sensor histidine kinase/response regulator [Acetobacterium woodii]|uniref:Circadian input-output histidine kinase CikA n=1 Tax=Acetobacterium woodii (strain ATCC 29683 / DSM 1030 / JCM 2381 / KCTC 1655 / WB1) TaxID=931626 RepID=H6LJB2_ACEWD|nr:PAS domain-containing hybrid sensor histidine kinase/response regulator [Acetobacterium woodii]AFA48675.1 putative sensor protein [Acetobacterium woodii DSM 1030]